MGSADESETELLTPDEAFTVLGNETRIEILQALGEAGYGTPISFTELRDCVGIRRGGEFNYHLDKLVGHFVRKTDDGYALRPAGHRVVEAVRSGAVTGEPSFDSANVDRPCPYCGSPVEVEFHQDRLHLYCPECRGTYAQTALPGVSIDPAERGYLGMLNFPPAGATDRDPAAVLDAATTWNHFLTLNAANGLCPRCSAALDSSIDVCTHHENDGGLCDECGFRHAVRIEHNCPKCPFAAAGFIGNWLRTAPEFVAFLVTHDVNPLSPTPADQRVWMDYDEEIRSVEPFEGRFTFTVDGDALILAVDDDLNVAEIPRP